MACVDRPLRQADRSPAHAPGWLRPLAGAVLGLALSLGLGAAQAQAPGASGKLRLTGGVGSIDGAAGGGLTPWAVIGSNAVRGQTGVTAFATRVRTRDYALADAGVAWGWQDRAELSLARQDFDTGVSGALLGLPGLHLRQTIVGAKVRLAGDAVLDADRWMPQLAAGAQWKSLDAGGLAPTLTALGTRDRGLDLYLSATKLWLASGVLVNGTLRRTQANQNGLLGFGGTAHDTARLVPEISLGWLLRRDVVVGAEYRAKPDNLNPSLLGQGLAEDDWMDLFLAWAPSRRFSLTVAYVDLGRIVPATVPRRQTGAYLSAQVAY